MYFYGRKYKYIIYRERKRDSFHYQNLVREKKYKYLELIEWLINFRLVLFILFFFGSLSLETGVLGFIHII